MKLSDFKNIHAEEDIYILASGKSVDFIDDSFFKNKIVIGVNQAFKKTHCRYLVRKEHKLLEECIQKCGKSIHFVSRGDSGGDNDKNKTFIDSKKLKNVVVYNHNKNTCKMVDKLPENDTLVVSYSTITTAIHLAAYMGAKNIILVGHDCGTLNNEPNFTNYHNDSTYKIVHSKGKSQYITWLKNIENQTIQLKKLLYEKYNCNIYSLNPFINFGLEGNIYKK